MANPGLRGPLSKPGRAPSKQYFICQVNGCGDVVRGDSIRDHYKKLVDEKCLDSKFKNLYGLTYQARLKNMTDQKKEHTLHFEKSKLQLNMIPSSILSDKSHWKPQVEVPLLTPFQRMKRKLEIEKPHDISGVTLAPEDESKKSKQDFDVPLGDVSDVVTRACEDKPTESLEIIEVSLDENENNILEEEIAAEKQPHENLDEKEEQVVHDNINVSKQIKDCLHNFFSNEEECGLFAEIVARKELEIKEALENEKVEEHTCWESGLLSDICLPCLKYSDLEEVPALLRGEKRGNFGYIKTENDENRSITRNKKRHEKSELHIWCLKKGEQIDAIKEIQKSRNARASQNVVRNALLCLQRGGSSDMFLALVNKDNLTEGVQVPTKNDSAKTFFDLRKVIFEEHSKRIKQFFQDNVKHITVTLDKVTVESTSYMVILTYFFFEGQIFLCLNKLEKMSEDDYDGEGTAVMVVRVLEETLGYNRFGLAQSLVHFVYDGVFANKEERVKGGGCLSLRKEMCKQLGLDDGAISGDWDAAHNMQCVWKDVITEHPEIMGTADELFKVMSNHRLGKAGTHFEKRAKELGYLILTNKKSQTTRFVRALVRGMSAALRNMPTLEIVQKESINDAKISKKKNKTSGRFIYEELEEELEELKSARNLMFILGLMQILEPYCEASLAAQHSKYFPSQVWSFILEAKSKIKSLSENWVWSEVELKFAQCGKPKEHLDRMINEKKYIPFVSDRTIQRNQTKLREFHGVESHLEIGRFGVEDLFEDENDFFVELTGEMKVEDASLEAKKDIEELLTSICKTLSERWDARQKQTKFQKMCSKAFGDIEPTIGVDDNEMAEIKSDLENTVKSAPGENKEMFETSEMLPGFLIWRQYLKTQKKTPVNIAWTKWVQSLSPESRDNHSTFIEFFQFVQIRSMSEAICETVGSIMNIQCGSGRHLQPVNFSAEICLRFNLGPLHLLDGLVASVITRYDREFIRRQLPRKYSKYTEMSSSVKNYRERLLEKCHVPCSIWK